MSTQVFNVVHSDVTITYDEQQNKWLFTLRGRDRSADSLAKAREFIDKPVPRDKAKPFQKIPAWFFRYGEPPVKIEITGIAEERSYSGGERVWIKCKRSRSKESVAYAIYPQSTKNDALVQQIITKESQVEKLREEISNLRGKLEKLVLPKDE